MDFSLPNLIKAAQGAQKVDQLFTNVQIVDVYQQRIAKGSVAVHHGYIVGVLYDERETDAQDSYDADEVIDVSGRYMVPGFIDGHLHIESTNISPSEYSKIALVRGTTTAIDDSHEIANVCGLDGLAFMIEDAKRTPLDIKFMMPSCVPALPFEQAGASLDAATMEKNFTETPGQFFGMGEMMNFPGVITADDETIKRIQLAQDLQSRVCDGHAPYVFGKQLNAYVTSGVLADHECTTKAEALDKLSRGMFIMMREGTCSHDAAELLGIIQDNPALMHRCCFCTDDRAPHDALEIGMIDNAVRIAVSMGVDPVVAITMASLTPSELFGLEHGPVQERRGAIAPGKRADFMLVNNLTFADFPDEVYVLGQKVAEQGKLLIEVAPQTERGKAAAQVLRDSVKLPTLDKSVFEYDFDPAIPAIGVMPKNAVTKTMRVKTDEGLRRIVLVERYGRAKEMQDAGHEVRDIIGKHIGRGFVKGYDICEGAVASTIGHDSHNVLIIGDNADDMLAAYNHVGDGGFVAVSSGKLIAKIDLPLGGLMSDKGAHEVAREHDEFEAAVRKLGVQEPVDPIMGLIFLSLPVIPEIRITPQGIFDVTTFTYF